MVRAAETVRPRHVANHLTAGPPMTWTCPRCGSQRTVPQRTAERVGGSIGLVTGLAGGFSGALRGATTAAPAGPYAAILGGLVGGAIGCGLGARVGSTVDDHILGNCVCQDCGHTHSQPRT